MRPLARRELAALRQVWVRWPEEYQQPGAHWAADQLLSGLRQVGVPVEVAHVDQPPEVVVFELLVEGRSELVAFDYEDLPEVAEDVAARVLLYFKQQYAIEGYDRPNVLPGGYRPASNALYRFLPVLRAVRSLQSFRYDVYCRFGLKWGGQEIRQEAHRLLSERTDFRYEGNLFRYPGGPDKVPYHKYLFEIPRAKVCVDMPGKGDFCTRLVDYLAVGACVVKPPPRARLPVQLVDGVHVVYCAPDLSDLADVCAQLVHDDQQRESIARNAREYFDRHLDRGRLAQRYVDEITDALGASGRLVRQHDPKHAANRQPRPIRSTRPLALLLATALLILLTLVALPEAFGDRPYDPRPSRALHL